MTRKDTIHGYLKEKEIESITEESINKVLRERPPDAALHMAATILRRSPNNFTLLADALHELATCGDGSSAKPSVLGAAWIAGKIGPSSAYRLTLSNLLDIFHIVKGFPALEAALRIYKDEEERVRATVTAAVSGSPSEQQLVNARLNLAAVGPLSKRLAHIISRILELSAGWTVDATGRVDNPPSIDNPEDRALHISQEEAMHLKRLIFPHAPAEYLDFYKCQALRQQYNFNHGNTPSSSSPVALVTVGAPGCGKSHILFKRFLPLVASRFDAPDASEYSHIDPDLFITRLCDNDNDFRGIANFCNHESFLVAVGQKKHMIFDGTGKDLINTCGRVISRMKQAGYRIYICLVAASYDTCMRRVALREAATGRSVPAKFVRLAMENMASAVPVYLLQHARICDALIFYDNEHEREEEPRVILKGDDNAAREALSFFQRANALPTE